MSSIAEKYQLPKEITTFLETKFLIVLSEDPEERTVTFHIPSSRAVDSQGSVTAYSLVWIHPDHNAEFCHYHLEEPGDLPNFYAYKCSSDRGDTLVPDLEDTEDLADWLQQLQETFG